VTHGGDLISDNICHLKTRNLIFYRDDYFEPIKPIRSHIVPEARIVRHARRCSAMSLRTLMLTLLCMGRSSF
jgi:hypothetical protein